MAEEYVMSEAFKVNDHKVLIFQVTESPTFICKISQYFVESIPDNLSGVVNDNDTGVNMSLTHAEFSTIMRKGLEYLDTLRLSSKLFEEISKPE